MRLNFIFPLFAVSSLSFAAIEVRPIGAPEKKISASGYDVPVFKEIDVTESGSLPTRLRLSGAGIREKKIALFSANVYVAESFVSLPIQGESKERLETIQRAPVKMLRLTFVRSVPAEKIRNAFAEALKDTGVEVKEGSPIAQVLNDFKDEFSEKSTLTLLGRSGKGSTTQKLTIQRGQESKTYEGANLVDSFWKIWFGTPSEGKLQDLKKDLVG